jgi:hypothetical protein
MLVSTAGFFSWLMICEMAERQPEAASSMSPLSYSSLPPRYIRKMPIRLSISLNE